MYKIALLSLLTALKCFSYTHFVLVSAPGSGKGTFSQYMVEKYGYLQICPGDIFREEIRKQTSLGKEIQPIVENGDYLDENLVCSLMASYMREALNNSKKFILDGFPRSTYSFNFLNNFFKEYGVTNVCFLQIIIDDTICIERILNRLICVRCSRVYNTKLIKNQKIKTCSICDGKLTRRPADTKEIFKKRIAYFHHNIEPLLDLAKSTPYSVIKINGKQSINTLQVEYDQIV